MYSQPPRSIAGGKAGRPIGICSFLNEVGLDAFVLCAPEEKLRLDLFFGFESIQLARQVQQERNELRWRRSNKEARKRLAGRHSRNGPWNEWQTHTHVVK